MNQRYLDLLCSVYLYNEHRGYRGLDRILEGIRPMYPEGDPFIARIEKHRADERKHYVMFKRWFERQGQMPYDVGNAGHIDGVIQMFFGRDIDDLETTPFVSSEEKFAKLCRAIAITERRGMSQVQNFLASPVVRENAHLMKIMKVIERDEPSHWEPYEEWLDEHGHPRVRWREQVGDLFAHVILVAGKFPYMLFNPRLKRRTDWPDDGEEATERGAARASHDAA